jgi:hypothetical protein
LPVLDPFWPDVRGLRVSARTDEVEKCRMSRVMATFCKVRKKFSPYVEKGKWFREA